MLKAIETTYRDYKFRSRLEARWAVFFDALGIEWEYEKEGFSLDGEGYLPDFWLATVNMWAEVKPAPLSPEERRKCKALANGTGYPCLMLVGVPDFKPYWAIEPSASPDCPEEVDYALSNHHDYPRDEHRFYCSLGCDETDPWFREVFADMLLAVRAARQARFEHGEVGRPPKGQSIDLREISRKQTILDALSSRSLTVAEIASSFGLSDRTVRSILSLLRKEKRAEVVGRKGPGDKAIWGIMRPVVEF